MRRDDQALPTALKTSGRDGLSRPDSLKSLECWSAEDTRGGQRGSGLSEKPDIDYSIAMLADDTGQRVDVWLLSAIIHRHGEHASMCLLRVEHSV